MEHRRRVESRTVDIPGLVLPTWQQVQDRDYEPWDRDHLVLDTCVLSIERSVETVVAAIDAVAHHPAGPAGAL